MKTLPSTLLLVIGATLSIGQEPKSVIVGTDENGNTSVGIPLAMKGVLGKFGAETDGLRAKIQEGNRQNSEIIINETFAIELRDRCVVADAQMLSKNLLIFLIHSGRQGQHGLWYESLYVVRLEENGVIAAREGLLASTLRETYGMRMGVAFSIEALAAPSIELAVNVFRPSDTEKMFNVEIHNALWNPEKIDELSFLKPNNREKASRDRSRRGIPLPQ